jgi:cytochrome c
MNFLNQERYMSFAHLRSVVAACAGALLAGPATADITMALGTADATAGERVFKKCASCHTVENGGENRVGPNLYGIVGQPVATAEDFRYSEAMQDFGGEWSPDRLSEYLENPRKAVRGTRMSFAGLKSEEDRADVIAFLNSNSDDPLDFETTQASAEAEQQEEEYQFASLFDAPGVETTFYACTACHSEMIIAQQGLSRTHWDEMLEWMVEEQGMSEIAEPERTEIIDYLATHYNEDRPNFPRALGN